MHNVHYVPTVKSPVYFTGASICRPTTYRLPRFPSTTFTFPHEHPMVGLPPLEAKQVIHPKN